MASSMLSRLAATLPYARAGKRWTPSPEEINAEEENWRLIKYTAWTWGAILLALLAYNITIKLLHNLRRVANLSHGNVGNTKQLYFTMPNENWALIKRHWLLAPIFRRRHMREFQLSAALNVGTLPSRIQSFWLLGYFAINIATCLVNIHWDRDRTVWLNDLCNRTGTIATVNMIPLFLLAGRNNPLIKLLDISFDNYNLIHRWVGRIVVVEAILHGAFWMAGAVIEGGWSSIAPQMADTDDTMVLTGTIGVCAFATILIQSPSILRHAFYETFLHVHIFLALVSVIVVWMHLEGEKQQNLLLGVLAVWIFERTFRIYTIIRTNVGQGVTHAEVEALPGDALKITLRVVRPWTFKPGQHIYLYMPSVGLWTSHPFSLAWSEESDHMNEKGLPRATQDVLNRKTTNMSLIIRRRTGFTERMWKRAERSAGNKFVTTAFVEGPYGNKNFQSYGTVMLFAAGVGITQQVPQVRDLVRAYANGTCATRKVTLVWIIQSPEHLEWIRPWMTEILSMEKRRDVLRILLFVTKPRSTKEIHSPSASVQMYPGRPNVSALIEKEQEGQVGAMAVSCCGTGSLSDDLRKAVRDRCEITEIDYSEESFSW